MGYCDGLTRHADLPGCRGKARTASCCRTRRRCWGTDSTKVRGSTDRLLHCCCFPRHRRHRRRLSYPTSWFSSGYSDWRLFF